MRFYLDGNEYAYVEVEDYAEGDSDVLLTTKDRDGDLAVVRINPKQAQMVSDALQPLIEAHKTETIEVPAKYADKVQQYVDNLKDWENL